MVLTGQLLNKLMERGEFLLLNQTKFLNEEGKVLERRVEMGFLFQCYHILEMLMVHMRVHSEQAFQDGLGRAQEVLGEGNTDFGGKEALVVQLILHPCHEVVNVLQGTNSQTVPKQHQPTCKKTDGNSTWLLRFS